jgi:hypothetical protein
VACCLPPSHLCRRRRRRVQAFQRALSSCARRRVALTCFCWAARMGAPAPRKTWRPVRHTRRDVCAAVRTFYVLRIARHARTRSARLAELSYRAVPVIKQLRPRAVCVETDPSVYRTIAASAWESLEPQMRFEHGISIDMLNVLPGGQRLGKLLAEHMVRYQPGEVLTPESLAADIQARSVVSAPCARGTLEEHSHVAFCTQLVYEVRSALSRAYKFSESIGIGPGAFSDALYHTSTGKVQVDLRFSHLMFSCNLQLDAEGRPVRVLEQVPLGYTAETYGEDIMNALCDRIMMDPTRAGLNWWESDEEVRCGVEQYTPDAAALLTDQWKQLHVVRGPEMDIAARLRVLTQAPYSLRFRRFAAPR